jgi:hypothetical protein
MYDMVDDHNDMVDDHSDMVHNQKHCGGKRMLEFEPVEEQITYGVNSPFETSLEDCVCKKYIRPLLGVQGRTFWF